VNCNNNENASTPDNVNEPLGSWRDLRTS
jgi:hypothetical protein